MRLSPLDIRKQEFDSALRGYSKEDVHAFLQMVSEEWEELLNEQRRAEDKVESLKDKMEHYEQVEEALQTALQTARENSEQKIENAQQQAALLVKNAEASADEIKREAREDREVMRRQVDQLQEQRDKAVARMRAFLMSEMELLLRFDDDPERVQELREALPDALPRHLDGQSSDRSSSQAPPAGAARDASPPESAEGRSQEPPSSKPPQRQKEEGAAYTRFEMPVSEDLSEEDEPQTRSPESENARASEPSRAAAEKKPAQEDQAEEEEELADFLGTYDADDAASPGASSPETGAGRGEEPPAAGAPSESSPASSAASASPPEDDGPSQEPSPNATSLDDAFASEQKEREEGASGDGADVASSDEIEKIRRILNDMD